MLRAYVAGDERRGGRSVRDAAARRRARAAAVSRPAARALHRVGVRRRRGWRARVPGRAREARPSASARRPRRVGRQLARGCCAARGARGDRRSSSSCIRPAPRPFDLDVHAIPASGRRAGALPSRRPVPGDRSRRAERRAPRGIRSGRRATARSHGSPPRRQPTSRTRARPRARAGCRAAPRPARAALKPAGATSFGASGWKSEASSWICVRPGPSSNWPPPYSAIPARAHAS